MPARLEMGTSTGHLRDALLESLKSLPGAREFHIHVLVSSPQKHGTLFPYAHPRPRTFIQHVLVLLSERSCAGGGADAPRVLVSALEAFVYTLPATSSALLYVAKVDSTGQARAPAPTAALVRAFLAFYGDPATRPVPADHLWVHVFARAQNQYLFPNSSQFPGKRWLSDARLCAWWKRQLSEVAQTLGARLDAAASPAPPAGGESADSPPRVNLYYLLPGLNELEAAQTIARAAGPAAAAVAPATHAPQWVYGHPYSQPPLPTPCAPAREGRNLGQLIPWFDDDPKSRFLDEIACTTEAEGVKSPERKRRKLADRRAAEDEAPRAARGAHAGGERAEATAVAAAAGARESTEERRPQGELAKVGADEFWERMSFRQECVSGAITGFFVLTIAGGPAFARGVDGAAEPPQHLQQQHHHHPQQQQQQPGAPQPGQVSAHLVKRVLAALMTGSEFSSAERAARSTETLENAIRGLCDAAPPGGVASVLAAVDHARRTPEPAGGPAPPAPPHTPPPRPLPQRAPPHEASPHPLPEPPPTPETYAGHIYGAITVDNPPPAPRDGAEGAAPAARPAPAQVTVLTARKKKKAAS